MVSNLKDIIPVDDFFRSSNVATDFFKRKDRSKACDISDVVGIRTISWNLSGTLLGCGSDNRGVSTCTLDPHSCRIKETASSFDHDDAVEGIEFSKHSDVIMASCSSDKTVRFWDMRIPLKSHSCILTKDSNLFLSWTNNGHYLILGDKSDTISLIDTRINKIIESVAFKEEINEFACSSNGELLFISTDHGKLEIFSIPKLKRIRTIQTHPQLSTCQSIAISPDERYISIGGSDACCSIWDLRDMICTKTLTRLDYPIRTISYSHCGNLIATGSEDRVIDISWAPTGEKITEVPIQSECFEVAWHPRLYLLAYATGIESVSRDRDRNDQVTLKIFGYSG